MPALIPAVGRVRQLDKQTEPDELVTPEDVQDPNKLAQLLVRILRDVAVMKRRFWPRRIDFEDKAVTSGDVMRLNHGFGGRVRYWVVDWRPTTPGDAALFEYDASTDDKTLCVAVGNSGKVTMRVESAG